MSCAIKFKWVLMCCVSFTIILMSKNAQAQHCYPDLNFKGSSKPRTESANSILAAGSMARLEAYRKIAIELKYSQLCFSGLKEKGNSHLIVFEGSLPMIYQPTKNYFDGENHIYTIKLTKRDWLNLLKINYPIQWQ